LTRLTWQKFFSDQPVFVAIECMTPMEEFVELVIRMSELVEAELPQAHVLEGGFGVLPRLEPVGACVAHQEKNSGHETANGAEV